VTHILNQKPLQSDSYPESETASKWFISWIRNCFKVIHTLNQKLAPGPIESFVAETDRPDAFSLFSQTRCFFTPWGSYGRIYLFCSSMSDLCQIVIASLSNCHLVGFSNFLLWYGTQKLGTQRLGTQKLGTQRLLFLGIPWDSRKFLASRKSHFGGDFRA